MQKLTGSGHCDQIYGFIQMDKGIWKFVANYERKGQ